MSFRMRTLFVVALGAALAFSWAPAGAVAARATHQLEIEVRNSDNGLILPARVGVFDDEGLPYPPNNPANNVYQDLGPDSYFYVGDNVYLTVGEGEVRIELGHGFEYEPKTVIVNVTSDRKVVIPLQRMTNMEALGWYSGDTHVHITHGPVVYNNLTATHLRMMARSEDLNFVNAMEQVDMFTGVVHPLSDSNRLLYFSKEQRNVDFAHLSVLGLQSWIEDSSCGVTVWACGKTLNQAVYDEVHAQGPGLAVIATHPFPTFDITDVSPWPGGGVWRAMPMDLVSGAVDAIDLLCYSHAEPPAGTYHYKKALNAGFRVPPSAGTDAVMATAASRPPGGYRVFVDPVGGGSFTMDKWIAGLLAGRSFVSNYPLITDFDVDGASSGDVITYSGGNLIGSISVQCVEPVDSVHIIGDRGVLAALAPAPGSERDFTLPFTIDVAQLTWVAAAVTGSVSSSWHLQPGNDLFAQTAPVYIDGAVSQASAPAATLLSTETCRDAANFFIDMLTRVDSLYGAIGVFPDSSEAAFDSAVANALNYFLALCEDPPEPFDLVRPIGPGEVPIVADPTPTFVWEQTVDLDPGDAVAGYRLLITENTFENPVFSSETSDTVLTLTEGTLTYGVQYKWRVEAIDGTGLTRVSTPAESELLFDPTVTGIGPSHATAWRLDAPHPNPFNPSVEIAYVVADASADHVIEVYDMRGKSIRRLFEGRNDAGRHTIVWTGIDREDTPVASGVYFVRLSAGETTAVRKVVLLK